MRNINNFIEYNEKVTWLDVLFGGLISATILLSSLRHFFKSNDVKLLYKEIVQNNTVTPETEKMIDSMRNVIIKEINNSDYENKQMMIDTIKLMPIVIVDISKNLSIDDATVGCYILPIINDSGKSIILLDKELINSDYVISEVLLHELYHYVKKHQVQFYEEEKDSDITYIELLNKVTICLSGVTYSDIESILNTNNKNEIDELKILLNDLARSYWDEREYLLDENEYYARYMQMKHHCVDKGYIKNVHDKVNKEILLKVANDVKRDKNLQEDLLKVILFTNWD